MIVIKDAAIKKKKNLLKNFAVFCSFCLSDVISNGIIIFNFFLNLIEVAIKTRKVTNKIWL